MNNNEEYVCFLKSLCIYELRHIARNNGILYAARYKKEDLINKILTTEPKVLLTNKGRPNKNFQIESNIAKLKKYDVDSFEVEDFMRLNQKQNEIINNFLLQIMALLETNDINFVIDFLKIKLSKLLIK